MATVHVGSEPRSIAGTQGRRLSVVRLAAAAGSAMAVIFVLCWFGTYIPFSSPTHAFLELFVSAEMSPETALAGGAFWSLLFGALGGAVFGLLYNALGGLDRR
jgi:hypothetical protein